MMTNTGDTALVTATIIDEENEVAAIADEVTQADQSESDRSSTSMRNRQVRLILFAVVTIFLVAGIVIGIVGSRTVRGNSEAINVDDSPQSVSTTSRPSLSKSPSMAPTAVPSMRPSSQPSATAESVAQLIRSVALNRGDEFDDPTSYQSKALEWLITNPQTATAGEDRNIQRYALSCILFATNSTRNKITDDQLGEDAVLQPWNTFGRDDVDPALDISIWLGESHECSWTRIVCGNSEKPWYVTKLDLGLNGLTGKFPPEVQLLPLLEYLSLARNDQLCSPGMEHNEWLGALTALTVLDYSQTSFEFDGGIPPRIGRLSLLRRYYCSEVLYSCRIQEGIFPSLTKLKALWMDGNAFSSSIPGHQWSNNAC